MCEIRMKKNSKNPDNSSRPKEDQSLGQLVAEVRNLVQSARHAAATTVNTLQVLTNFEIGRRIVEYEQKGEKRAAYGAVLLKELSARLTDEFGKGFSVTNLQLMRKFFVENQVRIQQKPSAKLLSSELGQTDTGLLPPIQIPRTLSGQSEKLPFTLSWSHYVLLLTIKNPEERSFYEIEATNEGWSLPELKRQVASCLYERLALSKDKEEVRRLAREGQVIVSAADILKEPYVLEFLGLDEKAGYSEYVVVARHLRSVYGRA